MTTLRFDIATLNDLYRRRRLRPEDVIDAAHARMDKDQSYGAWISWFDAQGLAPYLERLRTLSPALAPLYGVPFAVKDNIDLAGLPTTAGCPAFAYHPPQSAAVVERLVEQGAIPLGKTNLDQFATGLSGTRSPYGVCRNAMHPDYIAGGSSSGSAVALARGHVGFALGTDTAGSGRVPAAFQGLIGHKPTRGVLSTQGVVPACRSFDSVSIFAHTAADAETILVAAACRDVRDPYSRPLSPHGADFSAADPLRVAIPRAADREFYGDREAAALFSAYVERLRGLGAVISEIDWAPFGETASLLYGSAFVAERLEATGRLLRSEPDALLAPIREILGRAERYTAADLFDSLHRLKALQAQTEEIWDRVDVLVVPTAPTIFTVAHMQADPVAANAKLGFYTNFVNLLDLAATAVPAGVRTNGIPFGVTLVAPAHQDGPLLHLAARLTATPRAPVAPPSDQVRVAVVAAHLRGQPLNGRLMSRGARYVATTVTAPRYRLYALPGPVLRAGLVPAADGAPIEVEIWEMSHAALGSLLREVEAPLAMGRVLTAEQEVIGFVCSDPGPAARDITAYGGFRHYLRASVKSP